MFPCFDDLHREDDRFLCLRFRVALEWYGRRGERVRVAGGDVVLIKHTACVSMGGKGRIKFCAFIEELFHRVLPDRTRAFEVEVTFERDRKSTRLNSSH